MNAARELPDDFGALTPVDLLLGQGSVDEQDAARRALAADPMAALALAETVALFERLRSVRTDAGPEFAGKLADVVRRAELRHRARDAAARARRRPWIAVGSAAATFFGLWLADPLDRFAPPPVPAAAAVPGLAARGPAPDASSVPQVPDYELRSSAELAWQDAVEQVRRRLLLESSPRLRDAWEVGLHRNGDALSDWLDPRNAMVLAHLDHELRANAALRAAAMREHGGLAAVDERVQQLADGLAGDVCASVETMRAAGVPSVALAVRALVAAGATSGTRAAAAVRGGDWLAPELPHLYGEQLVVTLGALAELAAANGQHFAAVAEHGQRLVENVLQPDAETWARRLPDLLGERIVPATLGDAGRLLARLPAFGADPQRCALVRELLLGELRRRCDTGQNRPEILAAMLYGGSDLLPADERGRIERDLRRWKLCNLAPDFTTVQQLLWSVEPGRRGYARLQGELRQLATLPIPPTVAERAAFCLCLATNYAGYPGALLLTDTGLPQAGV